MKKVINFGPGPAKLPVEVLEKAQRELLDYNGMGISVLEMSHRSSDFANLLKEAEKLVRDLLIVPEEYAVLFMQGGGTGQFAAIPQNLGFLSKTSLQCADYVVTGSWSDKAIKEADKFITTNKVLNVKKPYCSIPPVDQWNLSEEAAYLYYCANETIHGIEFHETPKVDCTKINLVADISSNILGRPFDVSKHALAYAGTQKNIGAGGLTLVIVRKNLLGKAHPQTPSILNYEEIHSNKSLYNTPPCFNIYITKLVLEWIRDQGGVQTIFERNALKAQKIYELIDSSNGFYTSVVEPDCRSRMNIPFRIGAGMNGANGNESLETEFLKLAQAQNMISLKGHRSVGGIRASLYNAVSLEESEQLATLMKEFKEKNSEPKQN